MIICLSGWKQSGKDTVAEYLIKEHRAIRVALADPLKNSVAEEFRTVSRASLDDPKTKESPLLNMPVQPKDGFSKMIANFMFKEFRTESGKQPLAVEIVDGRALTAHTEVQEQLYWTPRALAILKGSTNRSVMSNYWTEQAFGVIQAELNENPEQIIVVTDVRYKSELAQFKERFAAQVVFVRINRHKESTSMDPSEMDLNDGKFDFYINNIGTLQEMHDQIEELLSKHLRPF